MSDATGSASEGRQRRHGDAVRNARTSEGKPPDAGVARELSEFARELQAEPNVQAVMQRIVDAAVTELEGATAAGITLLDHGKLSSPAHSNDVAKRVSEGQRVTGEGPCVDTSRQEVTLRVDDLRREDRWPNFSSIAVDHGILSILSFQLFVEGDSMGALDVYADTANAFGEDVEDIGLLLASHAAIAMSASRGMAHMRAALDSRDLIGQAKGILMERYRVTGDQAFQLLVTASQHANRKLRDIAEELTSTGVLPGATKR